MNKQKGVSILVGIAIIIAVAIVSFGGVFAYQYFSALNNPKTERPADQTAGWKKYANTEYGFEIKYPENWKTRIKGKGETGDYSLMTLQIDKEELSDYKTPHISISPETENFILGTRDWKEFELGQIKGDIACEGESKANPLPLVNCEVFFVSETGQKFYITTKNPELDNVANQILSTFKFTTPTDQTADWKTYTNTEYGFEVKYPKDFNLNVSEDENVAFISPPQSLFEETLNEGKIYFSVNKDSEILANCSSPFYSKYSGLLLPQLSEWGLLEEKEINGIAFHRDISGDSDMQGHHQSINYKTLRGNSCFQIRADFFWYSSLYKADYSAQEIKNIENKRKIVQDNFITIFNQILSTFKFLELE